MTETIKIMENHRSIRSFTDEAVSEEMISAVISAAQHAPTSINGQGISIIVIKDKNTREKMAELTGGQTWVAQAPVFLIFIADLYKTSLGVKNAGYEQIIHESVEGMMVASVDAGIALGTVVTAAESLGLGIVPIGAVRKNPETVIDLLELPEYTFPMVGLAVGHPKDHSRQKPRMDIKTFRFDEKYDKDRLPELINNYDRQIAKYLDEIGREQEKSWSNFVANAYKTVYFPDVYPTALKQGFKFDK